jgi:hypothetical protein
MEPVLQTDFLMMLLLYKLVMLFVAVGLHGCNVQKDSHVLKFYCVINVTVNK